MVGRTVHEMPVTVAAQAPLRVLHCIDNLGPGGKERQLVELLKGFSLRDDSEARVVSMSEGIFYPELHDLKGVTVSTLIRRWKKDPAPAAALCRMVRDFRPHTLVVWDHLTAMYAIPAKLVTGVRLINAMIQDAPASLGRTARIRALLAFPFADRIVANSGAGLRAYGVKPGFGKVIHNGFDFTRLARLEPEDAVRLRHGLPRCLIVGMVATFRSSKDQPSLIRAAERILAQRDDVVFVFVGDGETLAACQAMVAAPFVDRIRFTGSFSSGLESLIRIFDIGVLATFTEGISNSIMEYMALGKPVVATDGGGTRELLIDGETGFLVSPQDDDGLVARLTELLDDAALRARLGAAGRTRIEHAFNLEKLVEQHRKVYIGA